MAKNSNTFLSKLAPEDKRFIKRVGLFLFVLLLLSGGFLYFYTYFEKQGKNLPIIGSLDNLLNEKEDKPINEDMDISDSSEVAQEDTSSTVFELPEVPELPEVIEMSHLFTSSDNDSDFDIQAHLQLMRQNVEAYNYKLAYKHGHRIVNYLLVDPELSSEWGHILLEAGMPQEAVSVLEKQNSKNLIKGESVIDFAFAMHRSGNSEGAIQFLEDKLKDSKSADIIAIKAAIIGEHSDTTKRASADSFFKEALKMNPSLPIANYYYGRYLMQRGDFRNSKNYLEKAVQAKRDEPRYVARLGMAEFYLKQDANAEVLYKRALDLNPYDPNTYFNLGELYLSKANESSNVPGIRQKIRAALEVYLKSIEIEPNHVNAHFRIGMILNGNGEYAEAIKHLNIASEKMPNNISVMQQLSSAYLNIQDTVKSIDYLEKILYIDPFNKIAASEYHRITGKNQ